MNKLFNVMRVSSICLPTHAQEIKISVRKVIFYQLLIMTSELISPLKKGKLLSQRPLRVIHTVLIHDLQIENRLLMNIQHIRSASNNNLTTFFSLLNKGPGLLGTYMIHQLHIIIISSFFSTSR